MRRYINFKPTVYYLGQVHVSDRKGSWQVFQSLSYLYEGQQPRHYNVSSVFKIRSQIVSDYVTYTSEWANDASKCLNKVFWIVTFYYQV